MLRHQRGGEAKLKQESARGGGLPTWKLEHPVELADRLRPCSFPTLNPGPGEEAIAKRVAARGRVLGRVTPGEPRLDREFQPSS